MGGDRRVVEADDAELLGDGDAPLPGGEDDAGGHLVITGEDRGRARREIEQPVGGGDPGLERVIALRDQAARQTDAGRLQRVLEALPPLARGAEAVRSLDQADQSVALLD